MYTCPFLIYANLVKEGSFCINSKLVKEELITLITKAIDTIGLHLLASKLHGYAAGRGISPFFVHKKLDTSSFRSTVTVRLVSSTHLSVCLSGVLAG